MVLKPRDKQVIKVINDYRILRQDQVQRLLFPSKNTTQRRLQALWQHGYLKRDFLPVIGSAQTSPTLYAVDKRGVELLQRELGYDASQLRYSMKDRFDVRFLDHTLGLSETRIAVELACRQNNYQLTAWHDEKAMKANYDRVQLRNRLVAVLPDAYFILTSPGGGKLHFFVEYDSGSEHLKFLGQKLRAYWVYFQSGKCKTRYGTDRIRVLTIISGGQIRPSQTRLKNLLQLISDLDGTQWFWFTHSTQIQSQDILTAPLWSRADRDTPLPILTL